MRSSGSGSESGDRLKPTSPHIANKLREYGKIAQETLEELADAELQEQVAGPLNIMKSRKRIPTLHFAPSIDKRMPPVTR